MANSTKMPLPSGHRRMVPARAAQEPKATMERPAAAPPDAPRPAASWTGTAFQMRAGQPERCAQEATIFSPCSSS